MYNLVSLIPMVSLLQHAFISFWFSKSTSSIHLLHKSKRFELQSWACTQCLDFFKVYKTHIVFLKILIKNGKTSKSRCTYTIVLGSKDTHLSFKHYVGKPRLVHLFFLKKIYIEKDENRGLAPLQCPGPRATLIRPSILASIPWPWVTSVTSWRAQVTTWRPQMTTWSLGRIKVARGPGHWRGARPLFLSFSTYFFKEKSL